MLDELILNLWSILQENCKKLKPVLASKKPFAKDSANPSKLAWVVDWQFWSEVHTRFAVVYFDGNFQLSEWGQYRPWTAALK